MIAIKRSVGKSGLDMENITKLIPQSHLHLALPIMTIVEGSWEDLGNSKNRTPEQAARAKLILADTLDSLSADCIPIFTDGSALINPGPCGSAAIVYPTGIESNPICLQEAVSSYGSSYLGELNAILLAFKYMVNNSSDFSAYKKIHIFSDCQSALKALSSYDLGHNWTVLNIRHLISELSTKGFSICASWVCGHADLEPNELADTHAKAAACTAKNINQPPSISLQDVKRLAKNNTLRKWQSSWTRSSTGRHLYELHSTVSRATYKGTSIRRGEIRRNRLRLGHTRLREHLHKIRVIASAECVCGEDFETQDHAILHCSKHDTERLKMFDSIELIYERFEIPPSHRLLNTSTILGDNKHIPITARLEIEKASLAFLASIVICI
jgi:ribonuclease HI